MLITQQFMTDLRARILLGDEDARLAAATSMFHKESSMRPVYERLDQARTNNEDIAWDPTVKTLIRAIKPDKQRKYSVAIKYLEKTLMGQASKIFLTLKKPHNGNPLSEKLSKSQQRYANDLDGGDPGHGLCCPLALHWLKEQFAFFNLSTKFPRLADGNVVGSKAVQKLTAAALATAATPDPGGEGQVVTEARALGLTARWQNHVASSFENFHLHYGNNRDVNAFLITFWNGVHAIAVYRKDAASVDFYDANAGSYRLPTANLQEFLTEYNNVCLPLKWAGYHQAANVGFTRVYWVAKA